MSQNWTSWQSLKIKFNILAENFKFNLQKVLVSECFCLIHYNIIKYVSDANTSGPEWKVNVKFREILWTHGIGVFGASMTLKNANLVKKMCMKMKMVFLESAHQE